MYAAAQGAGQDGGATAGAAATVGAAVYSEVDGAQAAPTANGSVLEYTEAGGSAEPSSTEYLKAVAGRADSLAQNPGYRQEVVGSNGAGPVENPMYSAYTGGAGAAARGRSGSLSNATYSSVLPEPDQHTARTETLFVNSVYGGLDVGEQNAGSSPTYDQVGISALGGAADPTYAVADAGAEAAEEEERGYHGGVVYDEAGVDPNSIYNQPGVEYEAASAVLGLRGPASFNARTAETTTDDAANVGVRASTATYDTGNAGTAMYDTASVRAACVCACSG